MRLSSAVMPSAAVAALLLAASLNVSAQGYRNSTTVGEAYQNAEQQNAEIALTRARTEAIKAYTACLQAGGGSTCGAPPQTPPPRTDYRCVDRETGSVDSLCRYQYDRAACAAQQYTAALRKCTR